MKVPEIIFSIMAFFSIIFIYSGSVYHFFNFILNESYFKNKSHFSFHDLTYSSGLPDSIRINYILGNRMRNLGIFLFVLTFIISSIYHIYQIKTTDIQPRINEIIERCDKDDFSILKYKTIKLTATPKQKGIKVYSIQHFQNNCNTYEITIKAMSNRIEKVSNNKGHRNCTRLNLNSNEIQEIVNCFYRYNFSELSVDPLGNVYITDLSDISIKLLRVENSNTKIDIQNYKHYQGRWYVKQ